MDKAYDAVLHSEVDATVIAKVLYRSLGDRFRYQCLCCGEEVYLAAADSSHRSPHFRHRIGNNDTECERYLGRPGAVERYISIRKHQEHIDFCFNKDRMTFELCAFLGEEELQNYEKNDSKMIVSSKYSTPPFLSVPLNKKGFIPNGKNYFTITEFSTNYFVSFDSGTNYCTYQDVLRPLNKINIFRVNQGDEHCKCQTSSCLYTETEYISISAQKDILQNLAFLDGIVSEELFSFVLDNRVLYGLQFVIKIPANPACLFFQKYDYQIEISEEFSILWPPVCLKDSVSESIENTWLIISLCEMTNQFKTA